MEPMRSATNAIRLNIFWIDQNIHNEENQNYLNLLRTQNAKKILDILSNKMNLHNMNLNLSEDESIRLPYDIKSFDNVQNAVEELKNIKFKETIIIVSGRLFFDLARQIQNNINYIYVIPKIVVFSSQKKNYPFPNDIPNETFYTYEGTKTSFEEIKYFVDTQLKKIGDYFQENEQSPPMKKMATGNELIFENVENVNALPTFYQQFLNQSEEVNNNEFIQYIYTNYKNDSGIKELLSQMIDIPDIPAEILSKYYIRMFFTSENFFDNIKYDLLNENDDKKSNYFAYIKTLYEGVKKGALKSNISGNLYSAILLSQEQINELSKYKQNNKNNLLLSRSFLSFVKDINETKEYMEGKNAFITVTLQTIQSDFCSFAEAKELLIYENQLVLCFPFTLFELNDFTFNQNNQIYDVKLTCLGKLRRNMNMNGNQNNAYGNSQIATGKDRNNQGEKNDECCLTF